jgi:predicted O-methyltransferase YrrM
MLATASLLLIAAVAAVSILMLHKVRAMHLMLYAQQEGPRREAELLFRQTEALQGLYAELGLEKSLPSTRGWAASPDFLLELATHVRTAKPLMALECSSGVSTLVLARCMQLNGSGKVVSLEHDGLYADETRRQLQRHGLSDWAVVIDAPLTRHVLGGDIWPWYALAGLENDMPAGQPIDLLVIDGPPQAIRPLARYPAGPLLFGRLRAGAAVFLDDAARPGEQAILARWKTEFPALRQSSRRCEKGCAVLTLLAWAA